MENIKSTFAVFGQMSDDFRIAAGLIETVGGVLLTIGLLTRPVAFYLMRLLRGRCSLRRPALELGRLTGPKADWQSP
jgi:DoxX